MVVMVCPLAPTDPFNVRVKCDVPVTVTDFVTRFCVAKPGCRTATTMTEKLSPSIGKGGAFPWGLYQGRQRVRQLSTLVRDPHCIRAARRLRRCVSGRLSHSVARAE